MDSMLNFPPKVFQRRPLGIFFIPRRRRNGEAKLKEFDKTFLRLYNDSRVTVKGEELR